MMKRTIKLILPVIMIMCLVLGACGGAGGGSETESAANDPAAVFEGKTPDEILTGLDSAAGGLFDTFSEELNADTAAAIFMMDENDLAKVVSSAVHTPMMAPNAHMTALIECATEEDAADVAARVADGFNCTYWVCVSPDKAEVTTVGNYVFFLATTEANLDAYEGAFEALVGEGGHSEWVEISEDNAGTRAGIAQLGGGA